MIAPRSPSVKTTLTAHRLPGVRRVTIAAGFVCKDGIVMCADSQEVSNDYKWPVKKLSFPRSTSGRTRIIIAGAGFGAAIDTATQKIFARVSMNELSYEQTLFAIEAVLRELHEKDLPNHPYGTQTEFNLMIAFQSHDGGGGLFTTSGSLVTRVDRFEVIGSGAVTKFFAHMMYRETPWESPILTMSEGTILSAYLIYLAKSQLSSIGGKSQLITLDWEGNMRFASDWEVPSWEQFFSEYQWQSNQVMLDCADPTSSEEDFNARLDGQVIALKAMKRSLTERRQQWDEIWKKVTNAVGHMPMP